MCHEMQVGRCLGGNDKIGLPRKYYAGMWTEKLPRPRVHRSARNENCRRVFTPRQLHLLSTTTIQPLELVGLTGRQATDGLIACSYEHELWGAPLGCLRDAEDGRDLNFLIWVYVSQWPTPKHMIIILAAFHPSIPSALPF
jgi:hypothetical protein